MRRLSELKKGEKARIVRIVGPPYVRMKLLNIGLIPGTYIKMITEAPFGDPIEVEAKGSYIAIRRREAFWVFVE